MKLAASDYDGTLCRGNKVSEEDLQAIRQWREAGNLFGLATGRDVSLCVGEIESKKIELDFMICNTGGAVYIRDKSGAWRPLQILSLPDGLVKAAFTHPAVAKSHYMILCREGKSWFYEQGGDSWLTSLGLPLYPINRKDAENLTNLQQIGLEYKTRAEAAEAVESLLKTFGNETFVQSSGLNVDMIPKGVSKAEGIRVLLKETAWPVDEIITIGDTENDLSMIRAFKGFAVTGASDEVKQASLKVYESPGQMLLAEM